MMLINKAGKLASKSIKDLRFSKNKNKEPKSSETVKSKTEEQQRSNSQNNNYNYPKLYQRVRSRSTDTIVFESSTSEYCLSGMKKTSSVGEFDTTSISLDAEETCADNSVSMSEFGNEPDQSLSLPSGHTIKCRRSSMESADSYVSISSASIFHDTRRRNVSSRHSGSPIPSITISTEGVDDSISQGTGYSYGTSGLSSIFEADRYHLLANPGNFWNVKFCIKLAKNLPTFGVREKVDTYVKVKYMGKTIRRTVTVSKNNNPVWDESFYVSLCTLEYPFELRVYSRDSFRKNDCIGRVVVPLNGLVFGLEQNFCACLEDEKGRNVGPYIGELNFSMTLSEIPVKEVPTDRRRVLYKQLKTEQQKNVHQLAYTSASSSTYNSPNIYKKISCSSMSSSVYDSNLDIMNSIRSPFNNSEFLNFSMSSEALNDNDDAVQQNDWIGTNEMQFYQPDWAPCFYEGTKVAYYTSSLVNKFDPTPFTLVSRLPTTRRDINLDQLYTKSRLLVTLIRAENVFGLGPINQHAKKNRNNGQSSENMSPSTAVHSLPSCVAHLSVGKTTYKSRVARRTYNPSWNQEFQFRLKVGENSVLQIDVVDVSSRSKPVLIKAYLDFSKMLPDWTCCFTLNNTGSNHYGHVIILATLTAFTGANETQMSASPTRQLLKTDSFRSLDSLEDPIRIPPSKSRVPQTVLDNITSHYSFWRSFKDYSDVGWLRVYVYNAKDLFSEDVNGKQDTYCELRLVNRVVQTSTVYKTLDPVWNQAFVFPVNDIYEVLQIAVMRDSCDCIGRVAIPLTNIPKHKCKWYALKNNKLTERTKGQIYLEFNFIYNSIRASVNAAYPRERTHVMTLQKVKLRKLLKTYLPSLQLKIQRISPYTEMIKSGARVFQHLYMWNNHLHSALFLVAVCLGILFVQPYMIVLVMVIGICAAYVASWPFFKPLAFPKSPQLDFYDQSEEYEFDPNIYLQDEDSDEYTDSESEVDVVKPKSQKEKKKKIAEKLEMARQATGYILSAFDEVASLIEKVDSLFRWEVPWLSGLVLLVLMLLTIATYVVPMRYILVLLAVKKLTKRLRRASAYDISLLYFIIRIPDKLERSKYRVFRPIAPGQAQSKTTDSSLR